MPGRASVRKLAVAYGIEVNSRFRLPSVKGIPVEEQRLLRVLLRIVPAVLPGIQGRGVRITRLREKIVENLLSAVEAILVFRAAIEVNLHPLKLRDVFHQFQRVIRVPVRQVQRSACGEADAVDVIEESLELIEPATGDGGAVEVRYKRGAMRADGAEHFGMLHGDLKGAVSSHRDSADAACGSRRVHAVRRLDHGNEFLNDSVLPRSGAISGVRVKARRG